MQQRGQLAVIPVVFLTAVVHLNIIMAWCDTHYNTEAAANMRSRETDALFPQFNAQGSMRGAVVVGFDAVSLCMR